MFKYNLIGDNDYLFDITGSLSQNRGVNDLNEYLNLDKKVTRSWKNYTNIHKAVEVISKHIDNNSNIFILPDQDADGYTSASIMYQYLKLQNNELNIEWDVHDKKIHGLNEMEILSHIDLVIIPDASSNEVEIHKKLTERGIDVVVIDHHDVSLEGDQYAIIVNPKQDNKGNVNLSGAGVVYKVCEALDDHYKTDYAEYFLDLVAVGLIGDMMSLKDKEIRYYVNEGLENINNDFLRSLIIKQEYSMKKVVNPTTIAFYIVPLINAVTRVGTKEERMDLFKAFIGHKELVKYKSRGSDEYQLVPFIDDMARQCTNIKNRQGRTSDKALNEIISKYVIDDNAKVLVIQDTTIQSGTSGLIANQLASKYMKPVLILSTESKETFKGSGRGCKTFSDFKNTVNKTGLFEFAEGHDAAFGVEIKKENIPLVQDKLNKLLANEVFQVSYDVDFVLPINSVSTYFLEEITGLSNVWGRDISEPLFVVNKIDVSKVEISVIGKNQDTITFNHNDVSFIMFKQDINSIQDLMDAKMIEVIGKASVNEYKDNITYQTIISDYNILE